MSYFFINYFVFKSKTLHSSLAFKNKAWLLSRTLPTVFKVSHIVQLLFQIHSVEKRHVSASSQQTAAYMIYNALCS